jgi:hypothetical protein
MARFMQLSNVRSIFLSYGDSEVLKQKNNKTTDTSHSPLPEFPPSPAARPRAKQPPVEEHTDLVRAHVDLADVEAAVDAANRSPIVVC